MQALRRETLTYGEVGSAVQAESTGTGGRSGVQVLALPFASGVTYGKSLNFSESYVSISKMGFITIPGSWDHFGWNEVRDVRATMQSAQELGWRSKSRPRTGSAPY